MEEREELERYPLKSLAVNWQGTETVLHFTKATLFVNTSELALSWFVDVEDIEETEWLSRVAGSPDIRVLLAARTDAGLAVSGSAYLHPNVPASGAAVKGEGELYGYSFLKQAP